MQREEQREKKSFETERPTQEDCADTGSSRTTAISQQSENRLLRMAICGLYPLILQINLTRDWYVCFVRDTKIDYVKDRGSYDELVNESAIHAYPAQRETYLKTGGRQSVLEQFQRGEREVYLEQRQLGEDGEYHWISMQWVPVENPGDDDRMAMGLIRVLDQQRAAQARQEQLLRDALLAANSANRAKSEFLSRISHDIRTPMNAIIGLSALGQMQADNPQVAQDGFRKIDAASRYLLSLLNDILDMSRIEAGKMTLTRSPFDLEELMEECGVMLHPQADGKGLHLEMGRQQGMHRGYLGDSLRLRQILMNLLTNAVKFTPVGGTVRLRIHEEEQQGRFSQVVFTVEDNGVGMSREFMGRMFQPFEQESAEDVRNGTGSGLGLPIVYYLVHLMGGEVWADSKKNAGTVFTVKLPLEPTVAQRGERRKERARALLQSVKESATQMQEQSATAPGKKFHGQRLLLAEDNFLNMEIARSLLELSGFQVETVETGVQAVERFSAAPPGYFLAILMDVRMPGMDGLTATRVIRGLNRPDAKEIPILAMTANAFEEDRQQALEAGMSGYIVKPLDVRLLLRKLENLLPEGQ